MESQYLKPTIFLLRLSDFRRDWLVRNLIISNVSPVEVGEAMEHISIRTNSGENKRVIHINTQQ